MKNFSSLPPSSSVNSAGLPAIAIEKTTRWNSAAKRGIQTPRSIGPGERNKSRAILMHFTIKIDLLQPQRTPTSPFDRWRH